MIKNQFVAMVLLGLWLIPVILYMIRLFVISPKRIKAIEALHKFNVENIRKGNFNSLYFYDVSLGFTTHMLQFWKWDKYSTFKQEYREIIKPYFD